MKAEDKDAILRKLKGLLELVARDPESNESKTAANLAAKIMANYGISKEELKVTAKDGTKNVTTEEVEIHDTRNKDWELRLLLTIGMAFEVKIIVLESMRYVDAKPYKILKAGFIGFRADMEIAVWYYKYLRLVVSRKSEIYSRNEKQRMSYAIGMVESLHRRFKEIDDQKQEIRTANTKELVMYKFNILEEIFKRAYPEVKEVKLKDVTDHSAFKKGFKDGQEVGLGRPISEGTKETENGALALE